MVAVRGKNLRSGDLAEQLGVLLLQNLVLVSPVPRTEDVGIDVVGTLLSDFGNGRLLAEDNFFVQIKSSSVKGIEYEAHQVEWLYRLELPYFIATVERDVGLIKLYCCHRLSNAFITNHQREKVIIHFDDLETHDEFVAKNDENIHIGPPVAEWNLSTLNNDILFPVVFYNIMKEHISIYNENIHYRKVGWIKLCNWKTNEKPHVFGRAGAQSRSFEESQEILEKILDPYLYKWLSGMMCKQTWTSTAENVFKLMEKTRSLINKKD